MDRLLLDLMRAVAAVKSSSKSDYCRLGAAVKTTGRVVQL